MLHFNRRERAIVVIVIVAMNLGVVIFYLVKSHENAVKPPRKAQIEEYRSFADSSKAKGKKFYSGNASQPARLFAFNPNTADFNAFVSLGLKPWQANNIMKYRKAGGVFRKADDFAKIYGLSGEEFRRLKPYIRITATAQGEKKFFQPHFSNKLKPGEKIDLNTTDTALLQRVPGVGPVIAQCIVRYGQRLGGYAGAAQIAEVYGMSADAARWFSVESGKTRRINLNKATFKEMIHHPYLNYNQVRAVVRRIKQYGKLSSIEQLRFDTAFSEKDIERLKPYVAF